MGYRYVVLGAGRQGIAAAYDLARNGEGERVVVADSDEAAAARGVERLRALLPGHRAAFEARRCDVAKPEEALATLRGADVALSAVPYRFNAELAALAVRARCSFLDLGGNTAVVRAELALHDEARAAGVGIVPDCGLAPGLGNHLAAYAIGELDEPRHVHVRCGGLPERPVGPLGYKMLFHFLGLWNEYRGTAEFLRDGERVEVPTLTELEELDFGAPLGVLEAAVTSGGTSTCPQTWQGRLETFDYKTLRYPGHWQTIRKLFELGFMEPAFAARNGETIEPLAVTRALFETKLAFPDVRDLAVLRCTVSGLHRGRPRTLRLDLLDRHDEATGFTAMERTTAFPAALVAHFLARRRIDPGARPLEIAVPARAYFDELALHDVRIAVTDS
jgi:lysine 6-dehydrogenase